MELTAAVLAILLTAQVGNEARPAAPAARPTPQELAAAAVRLPADAKYRDVSLSEVLKAAPRDPRSRLATVQAYWNTWHAFADRAVAQKWIEWITPVAQAVQAQPVEKSLADAELAAARARLEESQLAVRNAQTELCKLLGWSVSGTNPRPSDSPLVGAYNTYYESVYRVRVPTDRAHLIHQTLPIHSAVLGAHGTARQAADDMVAVQQLGFQNLEISIEVLFTAWRAHADQQLALNRAARRYNELIAEYAVPLAGPDMDAPALVGMLIRSGTATARGKSKGGFGQSGIDDDVAPASFDQPVEAEEMAPGEIESQTWSEADSESETPAAEETTSEEWTGEGGTPADPYGTDPTDGVVDPYGDGAVPATPGAGQTVEDPFNHSDGSASQRLGPQHYIAAKVVVDPLVVAIFGGMDSTKALPRPVIERMQTRLKVSDQPQQRLPLRDCLSAVSPTRYAEVLDAYVAAWQAASRYQIHLDVMAQIRAAETALLSQHAEPGIAVDVLVLHAAEQSYAATLLEDEIDIWEAAVALGAVALPRTPGAKALPLGDAPVWATAAGTPSEQAMIAKCRGVVAMDLARAQAVKACATTPGLAGLTLQAIRRQNEETLGFVALTANAAHENGVAILAQLGPNVTAEAARTALVGSSTPTATRPGRYEQRYKPTTP